MDILEVMKELEAKVKANEYLYENTRTHQCQCIYDILSALRGQEDKDTKENELLKRYTTGRIRAIIGLGVESTGRFLVVGEHPLTPTEIEGRDKMLQTASDHFTSHYWAAVRAIEILYNYNLTVEKKC